MSIIVALSGGKASAYCADYALNNFPKKDVILYFNDTKWEHPDLYRFLNDLSKYWDKEITYDSDGRSPE
ncbi:MAG: phosphoadenosine phosphosulfate reductase family protein, partial [Planktothrix sp.]